MALAPSPTQAWRSATWRPRNGSMSVRGGRPSLLDYQYRIKEQLDSLCRRRRTTARARPSASQPAFSVGLTLQGPNLNPPSPFSSTRLRPHLSTPTSKLLVPFALVNHFISFCISDQSLLPCLSACFRSRANSYSVLSFIDLSNLFSLLDTYHRTPRMPQEGYEDTGSLTLWLQASACPAPS